MKLIYTLATIAALGAPLTFAQDSSGNGMLNGSYRFRYVAPVNYNSAGNVIEVIAAEGVIAFNGAGSYSIATGSQYIDNTQNSGKPQEFPANSVGTYVIGDDGLGYISSPLAALDPNDFGGLADFGSYTYLGSSPQNGVFTGSATESGSFNDIFVVMSVGAPATNSTFTNSYWLGVLDFSGGGDVLLKNALGEITPNGAGGFGTINLSGQTNNQSGTSLSQAVTGATYSFASDGGATLTLPLPAGVTSAANALFTGSRLMYVSADGNFVLGWNPNGYDIFFGVKALTAPFTDNIFKGLYYLGNLSDIPQQCGGQSFWGSENADGMEDEVVHQRFFSPACSFTGVVTDLGTDDYTGLNTDGTITDVLGNRYGFGAAGNAFVSIGDPVSSPGFFSLTIGIHAPNFSGSGVYLNPVGAINAASWDPITAGFAPGELITLFGSGLASTTLTNVGGLPFGTSLGTTQVLVNGTPAPIYYVSPTQVSAILPYALGSSTAYTAEIQVNNGGLLSNQISIYLSDANSGIFTQNENGIGDAIAEHVNGSLVTPSNPAAPGETIVLALTGMGAVTPTVSDGAIGPSSPLSYANNYSTGNSCAAAFPCLTVLFNDYVNNSTGQQATVSYAGLYPGLAGLYQMNVAVPSTVGPGEVYIEVITDEADVEQVTVCVSSCPAGDFKSAAQVRTNHVTAPKVLQHFKSPMLRVKADSVRTAWPSVPKALPSPARRPELPVATPTPQN